MKFIEGNREAFDALAQKAAAVKPKKNKKGLVIGFLGVALLIGAAGSGSYFIFSGEDEVAEVVSAPVAPVVEKKPEPVDMDMTSLIHFNSDTLEILDAEPYAIVSFKDSTGEERKYELGCYPTNGSRTVNYKVTPEGKVRQPNPRAFMREHCLGTDKDFYDDYLEAVAEDGVTKVTIEADDVLVVNEGKKPVYAVKLNGIGSMLVENCRPKDGTYEFHTKTFVAGKDKDGLHRNVGRYDFDNSQVYDNLVVKPNDDMCFNDGDKNPGNDLQNYQAYRADTFVQVWVGKREKAKNAE